MPPERTGFGCRVVKSFAETRVMGIAFEHVGKHSRRFQRYAGCVCVVVYFAVLNGRVRRPKPRRRLIRLQRRLRSRGL
ncbi:hypothetical protein IG631_08488 [Alternaria alternata]|nr:hypothetical protein IG631_08488 [Alternaria alternata]